MPDLCWGNIARCTFEYILLDIYPLIFNFLILELSPFGIKVSVNCPPDTNTPGFATEQATKPEETALICEGAGLFNPEKVARYRFQLSRLICVKMKYVES